MNIEFVDLGAQYRRLQDRIDSRMRAVLGHRQFILGPEVAELESRLAAFAGVKHCIGVSDGSTALMVALMALEIGAGDEVVTTPFTFIATAEMIALLGAKPVFVDIDPRTYNIDPRGIAAAITTKTRAIMPVSLYGQCADFDAIDEVARRHRLPVIEDGAQSFGAVYRGRRSCGLSTIATTSFFPSKPLGCYGDGGACFTDDEALAERMRRIRVHGQAARYMHPLIGLNGRLDTLQAAILLAKLEVFEEEIALRNQVASRYDALLAEVVATPHVAPQNLSVYAQYTIEVDRRDAIQARLRSEGVPTAVHYPLPLNRQPAFAYLERGEGSFPVSDAAARRVLSLPMHPYLAAEQQDHIAGALRAAIAAESRDIAAREAVSR